MADVFDKAQELEALDRQQAWLAHKAKAAAAQKLQPSGECLNPLCCEPFDLLGHETAHRLFCGPECAAEYERRK